MYVMEGKGRSGTLSTYSIHIDVRTDTVLVPGT
jgi:hypothetical protein